MSYDGYKSIVFRKQIQKAILMRGEQGFWGSQILDFFIPRHKFTKFIPRYKFLHPWGIVLYHVLQ